MEPTRSRILTFLVLPLMVIAVVVLLTITLGNGFQLEALREQSVLQATNLLASEKADRVDKRIVEQDNAVRSQLELRDLQRFGLSWADVAAVQTPTVRAVALLDLATSERRVLALASRGDPGEDERFRRLLVNAMLPDLELELAPRSQLRHLHKSYGEQNYLLSYWQEEVDGRRLLVVAWHYVPLIVHRLFPSVYAEREPGSVLNVVDAKGRIVFGPPLSPGGVVLGRNFETTLYKWRVNVSITSAQALGAAIAQRRQLELVMVALSSIVVVAGIVIVFIAADRERRLSALKSDFVANVSHELKTPLALVRMFAELLNSGRADESKRAQYLQIIDTESERLAALIDNVLDFARAERGRRAFDFQVGPLTPVVSRAVELCRARADERQLELLAPADLPLARFDERAVEVAVVNLIDNALKYAPEGRRVQVEIVARRRVLEVRVADEGPGIAPADRRRIFERFVRGVGSARTRGSGIGLALVRQIAESHGGKAWVESGTAKGSVFVLSVRRA